jgi:hypothetical protein
MDFRVVPAPAEMGAHAENPSILYDDTAYHRIDPRLASCSGSQLQRQPHIPFIIHHILVIHASPPHPQNQKKPFSTKWKGDSSEVRSGAYRIELFPFDM